MSPPSIVLAGSEAAAYAARRELESAGWTLLSGWELPARPWDLSGEKVACVGTVTDQADAASVLIAATRGAGLVVTVNGGRELMGRLFEDLSRLGPVEHRTSESTPGVLEPELRELLDMLARGWSQEKAAQQLNYSRRTVARRVAEARARLGVRTTAEALVHFRQKLE